MICYVSFAGSNETDDFSIGTVLCTWLSKVVDDDEIQKRIAMFVRARVEQVAMNYTNIF